MTKTTRGALSFGGKNDNDDDNGENGNEVKIREIRSAGGKWKNDAHFRNMSFDTGRVVHERENCVEKCVQFKIKNSNFPEEYTRCVCM